MFADRRLAGFLQFCRGGKTFAPKNPAEHLSLPKRWKRFPKSLTNDEIAKLLAPEEPAAPFALCDQAVLELAYASGLRLAELLKLIDSMRAIGRSEQR